MATIFNYEFPDFDYELPTIAGFEDTSWHNDICPSLTRKSPDGDESKTLILWCDYADPAKREDEARTRYSLIKGEYGNPDQVTLCESEDITLIREAIITHDHYHDILAPETFEDRLYSHIEVTAQMSNEDATRCDDRSMLVVHYEGEHCIALDVYTNTFVVVDCEHDAQMRDGIMFHPTFAAARDMLAKVRTEY